MSTFIYDDSIVRERMTPKYRKAQKDAKKDNPGYIVVHVGDNRRARRAARAMKRRAQK